MRSPKDICREVYEVGFGRDVNALDALIAPEGMISHGNPSPGGSTQTQAQLQGERVSVEELKETFQMFQGGFDAFAIEVDHAVGEGDLVAIHGRLTARHVRPFMGLPPNGRTIQLMLLELMRVENGRVVEHWGIFDRASLRYQMGETPPARPQS